MSAERENTETELKLAVPPGAASRFSGLFSDSHAATTKSQRLVTTYFDTPSRQLERSGLSLRVRSDGRRCVQTFKSTRGGDGAAVSRGEWEWPVKDGAPSLDLIGKTPAAGRSPSKLDGSLEALVLGRISRARAFLARGIPRQNGSLPHGLRRGGAAICSIVHCRAGLSGLQRSNFVPWRNRSPVTWS
jgi:CYTH domain